MAGRGFAPKEASKRARRNKDETPLTLVYLDPASQIPELPETFWVRTKDGKEKLDVPQSTRTWWRNWTQSNLAASYDELIWERLRIAAVLHARSEYGDLNATKEFRLHMANFPETPNDRLRQRIQVAQAIDAEVTATRKVESARSRFGGVVLPLEAQGS